MRILRFGIIIGLILLSVKSNAADPEGCMECHRLELVSAKDPMAPRLLHLDEKSLALSKHGELYCSDCHADAMQIPHRTTPEIVSCIERCHVKGGGEEQQKVHTERYYAYQDDVHFKLKYSCGECHNEFSSVNRLNASLLCTRCHREGALGDRKMLFSTILHGKLIGPDAQVLCVDCHTPHALEEKNESVSNAAVNCYRGTVCHGNDIGKKAHLGGHVRKKKPSVFAKTVQVIFQLICVLFVSLGSFVVYARKEDERDGKDRP